MKSVSFQTRARTIDHLGREQIADCPTAISELWKNSYDAYARKVELHIFDGDDPVAALVDDGHGMNRDEFETKWLTVGTESKTSGFEVSEEDKGGLPLRPKQGQKGIGRLSSAAIGARLLIVSKRKEDSFVASLIDWRLFENPYLFLHDIKIPIVEFDDVFDLPYKLEELNSALLHNIIGDGGDLARDSRLIEGWERFCAREKEDGVEKTTREKITSKFSERTFTKRQFSKWSVWNGDSPKGTAMFLSDLHEDMGYQLSRIPIADSDGPSVRARDGFFQTLSNFIDPFSRRDENKTFSFNSSVTAWHGELAKEIIGERREFDLKNLEDLEHIVDGVVDGNGYFKGRIKAFGIWYEDVVIKPNSNYKMRKDTRFGEFRIRIGSYEFRPNDSTMTAELHAFATEQAKKYAGLMVHRDGLRVMPYGKENNDYFGVEERRAKHAGMYFWAFRRMFGSVSISRESNPNLKDKAGREGFIENKASKLFREVVGRILTESADRFLGSKSDFRKNHLVDVKEKREQEKNDLDKKKLLSNERARIRKSIKRDLEPLKTHLNSIVELASSLESRLSLESLDEAVSIKKQVDELENITKGFSLSPVPSSLGRLEDDYREYRKLEIRSKELVSELRFSINKAIGQLEKKSDYDVAMDMFRSKSASLGASITRLSKDGLALMKEQTSEFSNLVKTCRGAYKERTEEILEDLKLERVSLEKVLNVLDKEEQLLDIENTQKLLPYITALQMASEQIDLEGVAIQSMNESLKWREEVSRLHALAQLGITVEIIGHEIEGLDMTVAQGLKTIQRGKLDGMQEIALENVLHAQKGLSDKWRFLSPLKLSGGKVSKRISGNDLFEYVNQYFSKTFSIRNVEFEATASFLGLSLFEQPARLYPIFVNLVNNSQYWVERGESNLKKIILDFIDGEVIVSDSGPGVDHDDIERLFTLFFTRKARGGRGVGLYLCKQNLHAGGHLIRYEKELNGNSLSGANFVITFKGMKND